MWQSRLAKVRQSQLALALWQCVTTHLLGELLLAEAIQHKELLGQRVVLLVATRRELDLRCRSHFFRLDRVET